MANDSGKFKRENNKAIKSFGDFVDTISGQYGDEVTPGYQVDKAADDKYLPKIKADRGTVKALAINDPLTRSAIDYRVQQAAGSLRVKPNPIYRRLQWTPEQNRDFRRDVKDLFKLFLESDERWIDISGKHTATEMVQQHTRIFESEGEAFDLVYEFGESRRSPLSFAIGNLDPDRIRDPDNKQDDDGRRIADGLLISRQGYGLGAFVHDYHRNDSRATFSDTNNYRFVPTRNAETGREQLIHSYVQVTSDLSRGISKLASCLKLSCQKEKYVDAALEDAISKAGLTFVLKSQSNDIKDLLGVLTQGDDQSPLLKRYMNLSNAWYDKQGAIKHRGNKIARLLHGEDLEGFSADQAGGATFETFSQIVDVSAAACHGLSLEEYLQRWDKTNFSGARSGKNYVWEMITALRDQAPWRFARKIYCLFLEDMILQGFLQLPGFGTDSFGAWQFFLRNKEALTCVEFLGSPKPEIDRAKTAATYLAEGTLGVGTWESYCNEVLGVDWEDRLDQIIEEVKTAWDKLDACGVTPGWSISEIVTQRLFGGNAFLAGQQLKLSGALDDPDQGD